MPGHPQVHTRNYRILKLLTCQEIKYLKYLIKTTFQRCFNFRFHILKNIATQYRFMCNLEYLNYNTYIHIIVRLSIFLMYTINRQICSCMNKLYTQYVNEQLKRTLVAFPLLRFFVIFFQLNTYLHPTKVQNLINIVLYYSKRKKYDFSHDEAVCKF